MNLQNKAERESYRIYLEGEIKKLTPELLETQPRIKQRRRVMHFIPAHSDEFIEKIAELDSDTIILDLEDSVPKAQKEKARTNIRKIDKSLFQEKELCIRISKDGDRWNDDDLEVLKQIQPDSVILPKVKNVSDIAKIREEINCEIIPIIEEISAYNIAEEIIKENKVTALIFGAEDFYAGLSVRHRMRKGDIVENQEDRDKYLRYVQPIIFLCTLNDIQFIDSVHTLLEDEHGDTAPAQEHLKKECELMKIEGALGKLSINPSQISVIKEHFDLSYEEIEQALNKLRIFNNDTAVIVEKHSMQDTPETAAAKRILKDALRYL